MAQNAAVGSGSKASGDPGCSGLGEATKEKKKNAEQAEVGVEGQIRHRISTSHDERYGPVHWGEIFRGGRWVFLEHRRG